MTPVESVVEQARGAGDNGRLRSGELVRPIQSVRRRAVSRDDIRTELEQYKLSLRKHHPVDRGLPWTCRATCVPCGEIVDSRFVYDKTQDSVFLEYRCPNCGPVRERHEDALFVRRTSERHPRQPEQTHTGSPIRPPLRNLPRTVETLCPECACIILGRYYEKDNVVYIEKTCPDHGHYRDTVNTDARLFLRAARSTFQDERGVHDPQVRGAAHCPSDCGLCNQHLSTSCLAQIDLSNRCNLRCPVCFANANASGPVAEPTYEMVVEMMQVLRDQRPYPPTAIQFTGGEPTIHPDFHRIVAKANAMGFTHVQIATNGITHANPEFARRSAKAGLHTLYLQFDGVGPAIYKRLRREDLWETKLACIENCRNTGMKVCLVPTIINGVNHEQVGEIFRFAVAHVDAISAIAYQPVAFTGRISARQREAQRYTLGDLAHDLAGASGADLDRDFQPLGVMSPLSRVMQLLDGKPKIRASCHSDCAFGTYFFVTPEGEAIPVPALFNFHKLMDDLNELAARIEARRKLANGSDKLRIAWQFIKDYRWSNYDRRISPFTFIRALQGLTNKKMGRGEGEKKSYRTLMAAGMHFMDRYNYDTDRIKRCVIQYSTPDGVYPFCTINGGPTFRPFIEKMIAVSRQTPRPPDPGHPPPPAPGGGGNSRYDSRTEAPEYSTARRIGKHYTHAGAVPSNRNKCSDRPDDGHVSSRQYIDAARARRQAAEEKQEGGWPTFSEGGGATKGRGAPRPTPGPGRHVHLDYRHPLEDYMARRWMQRLLGHISRPRPGGKTMIEEVIQSYANPAAPLWQRIKYWPLHTLIQRVKGGVSDATFRERIANHRSTLRGFVVTARSIGEFGLMLPQRFTAPLIVIWNFTNQCNLCCRHCYQDAGPRRARDELMLDEKLNLIDQLGRAYVPMMSFAGGEPTISKDLLPVLERCQQHGIHTSLATNGTTMTPQYAARLAEAGVKYVEISLDSTDPDKHDAFRGQPGMWERTVRGMKNVVAQDGLRLGVAMCVHQGNSDEVEAMLQFAVDTGASCFAHFNFIPVGRGLNMTASDLTPPQRERVLHIFNDWMQSGRISVMSTAPQLGRVSLAHAPIEGLQSCSHIGGGGGEKARVVAKYLGGCGAGRTYACIEPDGTITPCVYMPHRVLGNIRNRSFIDIFRNNEFRDVLCDREHRTHHCEVCEFKYYCGGCRARADAYFGRINAGDPGCVFNSKHWDELVETDRVTQVVSTWGAASSRWGDSRADHDNLVIESGPKV